MAYTNGISNRPRPARNAEIYERTLLGESHRELATEFGVHKSRIYAIVQVEERRRRLSGELWGERLVLALARAAYLEDLEPVE